MKKSGKRIQIGAIGPDRPELPKEKNKRQRIIKVAHNLGRLIAMNSWTLFTGGTGGVMREASFGAKRESGLVVGVPGNKRGLANQYVDVEVVTDTDIGSFNCAGLLSCDLIIVIPGGSGTLAELCLAYRYKKPIIIMKGFDNYYDKLVNNYLDRSKSVKLLGVTTAEEAIILTKRLLEK